MEHLFKKYLNVTMSFFYDNSSTVLLVVFITFAFLILIYFFLAKNSGLLNGIKLFNPMDRVIGGIHVFEDRDGNHYIGRKVDKEIICIMFAHRFGKVEAGGIVFIFFFDQKMMVTGFILDHHLTFEKPESYICELGNPLVFLEIKPLSASEVIVNEVLQGYRYYSFSYEENAWYVGTFSARQHRQDIARLILPNLERFDGLYRSQISDDVYALMFKHEASNESSSQYELKLVSLGDMYLLAHYQGDSGVEMERYLVYDDFTREISSIEFKFGKINFLFEGLTTDVITKHKILDPCLIIKVFYRNKKWNLFPYALTVGNAFLQPRDIKFRYLPLSKEYLITNAPSYTIELIK